MLSEKVAGTLIRSLGVGYFIIAVVLIAVVPLGLLVLLLIGVMKDYASRFGLFMGLAIALWASLCWIVVPYCGGYPNIPGMVIGGVVYGVGTWGQEVSVHVVNLVVWPFIGWILFKMIGPKKSEILPEK